MDAKTLKRIERVKKSFRRKMERKLKKGIYENFGDQENREFSEILNGLDITYMEKCSLQYDFLSLIDKIQGIA